MTLEDKFEEAEFFLKKIKETDPDLSQVKHYFSAFLYSIESIPDYLLADAAIKYGLGLPIDEKWRYQEFNEKAKELDKEEAQDYYQQWSAIKNAIDQTPVGKIFSTMRDIHTHKTTQRPDYFLLVTNKNPKVGEDVHHKLLLHPKGHPTLEDALHIIETNKKHYLNSWNKQRGKNEQLTDSDMVAKLWISIDELQNFEFVELCEKFLQVMKKFAEISAKD